MCNSFCVGCMHVHVCVCVHVCVQLSPCVCNLILYMAVSERCSNSVYTLVSCIPPQALHMVEESTLLEMPHIPQVPDMLPLMSTAISICTWPEF